MNYNLKESSNMTKQRIVRTLEAAYKRNHGWFKATGNAAYQHKCDVLRGQLVLLYDDSTAAAEVEHLNEMVS